MKITRPILSPDIETTDSDPVTCAIWEYGYAMLMPDGSRKSGSMRFKPWKPIIPEVEELTGVTNEMLEGCPPFSEWAIKIAKSLDGKDLVGYNVRRFDIIALDQECRRVGFCLDLKDTLIIDGLGIFQKKEPRKLEDAVRRFCGHEHTGAHGAEADSAAALDVVLGQLEAYQDLAEMDLAALAAFSSTDDLNYVDLARKLYRDADGFCCYAFGKNKGVRVAEDISYARWVLKSDFPGSTLDALEDELARLKGLGK